MPLNQGLVGVQNNPAGGNNVTARFGAQGDASVSELHGRYYEQALRGNLFSGSIVGQVTTVGLAATYTGLCLSNPIGSAVNLSVLKCGFSFLVVWPAVSHVGLMTGYNSSSNVTHTTPVTPRSRMFVGAAGSGKGLLDSSATLPTAPTVDQIFGSGLTGAATTVPFIAQYIDVEGSLVLPPGAYVAFYTSTVSGAAAGGFSFLWEEVPVNT